MNLSPWLRRRNEEKDVKAHDSVESTGAGSWWNRGERREESNMTLNISSLRELVDSDITTQHRQNRYRQKKEKVQVGSYK